MKFVDMPGGWVAFFADTGEELGRVLPPEHGFTVDQIDELFEDQGWGLADLVQFAEHMRTREERLRVPTAAVAR